MAKRAVLCDSDYVEIAHVGFSEMDGYIERGLVERLTPIRAKTHRFRLLVRSEALTETENPIISPCSLTASISRDNAGEYGLQFAFWARRKVRAWPNTGDVKTGDCCLLILRRPALQRKLGRRVPDNRNVHHPAVPPGNLEGAY